MSPSDSTLRTLTFTRAPGNKDPAHRGHLSEPAIAPNAHSFGGEQRHSVSDRQPGICTHGRTQRLLHRAHNFEKSRPNSAIKTMGGLPVWGHESYRC